jgi:hypothetical protein
LDLLLVAQGVGVERIGIAQDEHRVIGEMTEDGGYGEVGDAGGID